jgi:COP9 signalosome complex subunit 2
LAELQDSCNAGDVSGAGDKSMGTQLLEVYALQIQMATELKDSKRLAEIYSKALAVKAAVPHPGIWGVIRECGGKMHMRERAWSRAYAEFLEAFKAYMEASNSSKTISCLKYMLLANMLSDNRINPFDSQDTKAYQNDPQITTMTQLTDAYLANDIGAFGKWRTAHGRAVHAQPALRWLRSLLPFKQRPWCV